MSKVLILGSTSALSKMLTERLGDHGHLVSLVGRNSKPYSFNIESTQSISTQDFDAVILVSWIQSPRNHEMRQVNEQAVKRLLNGLTANQKFVFISSQAASNSARSQYGKGKFHAELAVRATQNHLIVRPATIIGKDQLMGAISQSFVAKLLTRNRNFLSPSTVDLESLTEGIVNKFENCESGTFELSSSEGWVSNSTAISQIVRIATWPLALFGSDFTDRALSYIDLKFPIS